MYPRIIGLVGPIRAGKSSVATYLCENYGYNLASNSDLLRKITINLGMDTTRENLTRVGNSIFSVLGNDTLARYRLSIPQSFPIIVDGIRYREEIDVYSKEPGFRLLGIDAPDSLRNQRANLLIHEGKDPRLDNMQFSQLHLARSELQVEELLRRVDSSVINNLTLVDLFHEIDQIMSKWK